jgi:hypothetical protein
MGSLRAVQERRYLCLRGVEAVREPPFPVHRPYLESARPPTVDQPDGDRYVNSRFAMKAARKLLCY